jgi:hypothetical protein
MGVSHLRSSEEFPVPRCGKRFFPVVHLQFVIEASRVGSDGVDGDDEFLRYLGIGETSGEQAQDLSLTTTEWFKWRFHRLDGLRGRQLPWVRCFQRCE